MLKNRLIICFY